MLTAAIAAGLISLNTEAIESPGNNNQVYQERLLSDQKVILAKTGDSSPSVPTSPGRGQPSNFPTPPAGVLLLKYLKLYSLLLFFQT